MFFISAKIKMPGNTGLKDEPSDQTVTGYKPPP
jgi:hypothetical protein